jgi:RHS repeat-associated protein
VVFDTAGREVAEDYSPCLATHPPYTPPDLTTGDGTEAFYVYDDATVDPDVASAGLSPSPMYLGRLVSVSDRGAKMIPAYDLLGRVVEVAKKVAAPGAPAATLANRYAAHWWTKSATYDAASRIVSQTTGAEQLLGSGGSSLVGTSYSARGLPTTIAGSYGTLVAGSVVDADGRPLKVTYGDSAGTSTVMQYDTKRRLVSACTAPAAAAGCPPVGTAAAGTGQGTLSYFSVGDVGANNGYDGADNPLSIKDLRNPAEWTAGAMPVSRAMQYDDLYRLTKVDYSYSGGPDAWTDPFAFEDGGGTAPRLAEPSPHVTFPKRIGQQTYSYDWLGNTASSGDDANGFYDRSLGKITNGGVSPYQLTSASNEGTGAANTAGHLTAAYDAIGDLVSMAVVRNGPCLPASVLSCSQRFVYDWDEVGQMARARRWDGDTSAATDPVPSGVAAADLSYVYGGGGRVLKAAADAQGNTRATVYVFSGLELRRAQYFAGTNDYERSLTTEVVDLGLARLSYEPNAPSPSSSPLHVLLRVGDSLGSSSVLVDKETGQLAEARTYQPYGETESDYRPSSFAGVRDDVGFTGKEEDVELGIQYFGARYLVPGLGRWASADPVATHALGADLNEYAYVHGRVYASTDPTGLDDDDGGFGKTKPGGPSPTTSASGDSDLSVTGPGSLASGDSPATGAMGEVPVWLIDALPASVVSVAMRDDPQRAGPPPVTSPEQIAEFQKAVKFTENWWSLTDPVHIVGDRWLGHPLGRVTVGEITVDNGGSSGGGSSGGGSSSGGSSGGGSSSGGTGDDDNGGGLGDGYKPRYIVDYDYKIPEPPNVPLPGTNPNATNTIHNRGVYGNVSVIVGYNVEVGFTTRDTAVGELWDVYLSRSKTLTAGVPGWGVGISAGNTYPSNGGTFLGESSSVGVTAGPISVQRDYDPNDPKWTVFSPVQSVSISLGLDGKGGFAGVTRSWTNTSSLAGWWSGSKY